MYVAAATPLRESERTRRSAWGLGSVMDNGQTDVLVLVDVVGCLVRVYGAANRPLCDRVQVDVDGAHLGACITILIVADVSRSRDALQYVPIVTVRHDSHKEWSRTGVSNGNVYNEQCRWTCVCHCPLL